MPSQFRTLSLLCVGALLATGLAGCGGDGGEAGGKDKTLQVLAASSLTDVFADLASDFEATHDGVKVEFSFGSSTDLAEQATDGAPGAVLATADEASMTIAADAGSAISPVNFASNVLVIVTAPGNPASIESLDDLADATWVRCADAVPCGKVALAVLGAAGITAEPASLEEDVRSTLDKVTSGEADAALVYATDAQAATTAGDDIETIEIPGADEHRASYFIAPLTQAADDDLAQQWVDFVVGDVGVKALTAAGFSRP